MNTKWSASPLDFNCATSRIFFHFHPDLHLNTQSRRWQIVRLVEISRTQWDLSNRIMIERHMQLQIALTEYACNCKYLSKGLLLKSSTHTYIYIWFLSHSIDSIRQGETLCKMGCKHLQTDISHCFFFLLLLCFFVFQSLAQKVLLCNTKYGLLRVYFIIYLISCSVSLAIAPRLQ